MTIQEAESTIRANNLSVEDFWEWMNGQTMGTNSSGGTEVYNEDVERFVRSRRRGYELSSDFD